jgi:HAMP domain-containing protein
MRLRIKLASVCALTAILPLIGISVLIVRWAAAAARTAGVQKLESEARAAESIYEKRLIEMRSAAQGLADEIAAKSLLDAVDSGRNTSSGPARGRLQDLLTRSKDELSLDFLLVADPGGQVIARHNDSPKPGESLLAPSARNPLAEEVIDAGGRLHVTSLAAPVIEQGDFLSRMWLDAAARIKDAPQTGALVIESCAPIMSSGRFLGIVLAGQMLNNYYRGGKPGSNSLQTPVVTEARLKLYPGIDQGAGALVALGDTVIASSVLPSPTSEPVLVGARHDPAKNLELIGGDPVQYLISWRPVKSVDGSLVGAIGAATSAGLQSGVDFSLTSTLALAAAGTALLVGLAGAFWAGIVSRRVAALSDAVSRMRVGELSRAVRDSGRLPNWVPGLSSRPANGLHSANGSAPGGGDEIEELAGNLDLMRESFKHAIERLRKNR